MKNKFHKKPRKVKIFGILIDALDMNGAVNLISSWLNDNERSCRFVVTPNTDHIVQLDSNSKFRAAYEKASLILADGFPVVLASKLFGQPLPGTVHGSDLVPALFDHLQKDFTTELSIFLLGAAPGVAERASNKIQMKWPHVKVVGVLSPTFGFELDHDECQSIFNTVAKSGANLLIIGLSPPKQEIWISQYSEFLPVKVALCVGATIDFLADEKPRAPMWMRNNRLEWFHRVVTEPRRLAGRYFKDALIFPILVLKELRKNNTD
jgi:N-acetylglucosaminyldiphosphoundecaprenol N-acetyl-beta-D-mannosaminyltransferase